jgi:hypothetical protein
LAITLLTREGFGKIDNKLNLTQAKTPKTAKLGAKHKNLVATSLIMRAVR